MTNIRILLEGWDDFESDNRDINTTILRCKVDDGWVEIEVKMTLLLEIVTNAIENAKG